MLDGAEAGLGPVIQKQSDVRTKNQVTVPSAIARALGLRAGDRILFVFDEREPGEAHIYRLPESFAGIAPHAYGGPQTSADYVRKEREGWEE